MQLIYLHLCRKIFFFTFLLSITSLKAQLVTIGDYTFRRNQFIAKGNFGSVYNAQKSDGSSGYVIKEQILPPEGDHKRALILQELKIQEMFDGHPLFLEYDEAVIVDGTPSYVYIPMQKFGRELTLPVKRQHKDFIIRQLFEGTFEMMSKGVIHRDLKPQNILYDERTGRIKIIDFGLSDELLNRPTRRCGTEKYLTEPVLRSVLTHNKNLVQTRGTDLGSMAIFILNLLYSERMGATVEFTGPIVETNPRPYLYKNLSDFYNLIQEATSVDELQTTIAAKFRDVDLKVFPRDYSELFYLIGQMMKIDSMATDDAEKNFLYIHLAEQMSALSIFQPGGIRLPISMTPACIARPLTQEGEVTEESAGISNSSRDPSATPANPPAPALPVEGTAGGI